MSRSYRALVVAVRGLLSTFFRRIEVSGLENVPATSGGLIVAWHPNALVDPALIFTSCPGAVVFGARHGLFAWPVIGRIMRAIGAVPIYRAEDLPAGASDAARREANQKSLNELAKAVANGAFTALFPEGLSHDDSSPKALKTGAARIFYQSLAETPAGKPLPVLLPVGLHYDEKRVLGSNVLIVYHPPLVLDGELAKPPEPSDSEASRRARYRGLTEKIEQSLKDIVHATENWEIHQLLHRGRKLVRAERAARAGATLPEPTMTESVLGFRRLWTGYNELKDSRPEQLRQVLRRIKRYDRRLAALAIDDHELDANPAAGSRRQDVYLAIQALLVFVVLPPVLLLGFVVNLPPAALVWLISKRRSKAEKDEATIKLLAGLVAFPLAWLVASVAVVIATGSAWLTGVLPFLLSALGGLLTLHYRRLAARTWRKFELRTTHADNATAVRTLLGTRSAICDEVLALSAGLDLPGVVLEDGRVLDETNPW